LGKRGRFSKVSHPYWPVRELHSIIAIIGWELEV
jgi:hypothetical protein